ncbi:DUF819 family protein [soil metagenome]
MPESTALITNDAVVLGLLALILGAVFYTERSQHPVWRRFYKYVPALLLCYFLPSLFNTFGVIDAAASNLYFVASRFLLPACLVLLTMSTDLPAVFRLGYRAIVMFLTGTIGIVLGGPLAILLVSLVSPETVAGAGPDAVWRGLTTVAGSWIGGGANQAAMKEIFDVGDTLFSQMIAVDVFCANVWLAILLFAAGRAAAIDARLGADTSAIEALKLRVEAFHEEHAREANLPDFMFMLAISFGITGFAHLIGGWLASWIAVTAPALDRFSFTSEFFWIIVISTTAGVWLSFTRARNLEGAGASKVGSAFLYVLIATIGMNMDITAVLGNPGLFAVGGIWMATHALLLIVVAWLIKAPLFYMAVGSQANVGGAASAPVVAAAFHPSLASVGVLLAVLGYTLGTYGAWLSAQLMRIAAPGSP